MAKKNIILSAKTMGISTPIVARGFNPHEAIRQSALILDGPALDGTLYAHDFVLVDAAPNGVPGFNHLPKLSSTTGETTIVTYASDRGINGVTTLADFVTKFAGRLGLVLFGSEQAEMNMLSEVCGDDAVECEYNNVIVLKDAYIKRVILPAVDETFANQVVIGGCLKLVALGAEANNVFGAGSEGKIVPTASYDGAAPEVYDTTNIADIPGTTVINAGTYRDNDGNLFTTIDFVC